MVIKNVSSDSSYLSNVLLDKDEEMAVLWWGKFILANIYMSDKDKMKSINYELHKNTELTQRAKDIVVVLADW